MYCIYKLKLLRSLINRDHRYHPVLQAKSGLLQQSVRRPSDYSHSHIFLWLPKGSKRKNKQIWQMSVRTDAMSVHGMVLEYYPWGWCMHDAQICARAPAKSCLLIGAQQPSLNGA